MMRLANDRVPRGRPSKDGTIDTVASVSQYSGPADARGDTPRHPSARHIEVGNAGRHRSARRPRYFCNASHCLSATTFLHLDLVAIGLILLHQFFSGKLLIQYDRLLWFLGFALASTCSLLLNFKSTMLTAYFQFVVLFSLFTLSRPSTPDQYKSTLQAFQFLVLILHASEWRNSSRSSWWMAESS